VRHASSNLPFEPDPLGQRARDVSPGERPFRRVVGRERLRPDVGIVYTCTRRRARPT